MINEEKKNISYSKLVIIFTLGSFLGVVWENLWGIIKRLIKYHKFSYRDHRGVIYGPFNPLYGFCITLIIILLGRKKRSNIKTFILGSLLGGLMEYIASFLLELLFNAKSWDYSNQLLNINGRTSLTYMLFWGLGITLLIQYAYPYIVKKIDNIPFKIKNITVILLTIFLSLDMLISLTALTRQSFRKKGYEPLTIIGEFCDKYYPDEFMKKIYVNMSFK